MKGAVGRNLMVVVCESCGSLVADQELHTKWHESLTDVVMQLLSRAVHDDD